MLFSTTWLELLQTNLASLESPSASTSAVAQIVINLIILLNKTKFGRGMLANGNVLDKPSIFNEIGAN